jgi:hypothetical protein
MEFFIGVRNALTIEFAVFVVIYLLIKMIG